MFFEKKNILLIINKVILQDSQGNWFSVTDDKEAPHGSQ